MAPAIVVLIPAHDEAAHLPGTLRALQQQTRRPDRVVVVADNCTDDTVALARAAGAEVFETVGNTDKKAGALNQALAARFRRAGTSRRSGTPEAGADADRRARPDRRASAAARPDLADDDLVLVMDADTVLSSQFLEEAARSLESDERIGAAGGIFYGDRGAGLLGQLQRNEYTRYGREIARTGRVMVLTGTGTLFRSRALRQVAEQRGTTIPGRPGHVYDTLALTEDNELTLALKTLGWRMTSPPGCVVTTEIMPTWGDLWRQRLRWQRGALENLRHYGLTRTTLRYWGQQLGIGVGVLAFQLYLLLVLVIALDPGLHFGFTPLWSSVGLVFLAERLVTVWRGGWAARAVAAPLVVELAYDAFVQAVFVRSLTDLLRGREARWHHVTADPATLRSV